MIGDLIQSTLFGKSSKPPEEITDYVVKRMGLLFDREKRSIFFGSPFERFSKSGPKANGKAGERLIRMLAGDLGYTVKKSRGGDVKINGIDAEVKFARQSETGGFVINQLRPQDYAYVVVILVRPKKIHLFTVPKDELMGLATGQHGGSGASETRIYRAYSFEKLWRQLGRYGGLEVFRCAFEKESR